MRQFSNGKSSGLGLGSQAYSLLFVFTSFLLARALIWVCHQNQSPSKLFACLKRKPQAIFKTRCFPFQALSVCSSWPLLPVLATGCNQPKCPSTHLPKLLLTHYLFVVYDVHQVGKSPCHHIAPILEKHVIHRVRAGLCPVISEAMSRVYEYHQCRTHS